MERAGKNKLSLAKAKLDEAFKNGNPKEIARAIAGVVAADPQTTDVFYCAFGLIPLFEELVKSQKLKPLDSRTLRTTLVAELDRVQAKRGVKLSVQQKRFIIDSAIRAIKGVCRFKK